jgi:hypothetical protein
VFIFIARCSDAFLAANKAENTSGIFGFAHVVPVSITDLNNFEIVKKRAVACLLFQPCGFIFSLEGFPYNANIPELINQLLGCSRVVNGDVARIVPMFQKEREEMKPLASGFVVSTAIRLRRLVELPALAQEKKVAHVSK